MEFASFFLSFFFFQEKRLVTPRRSETRNEDYHRRSHRRSEVNIHIGWVDQRAETERWCLCPSGQVALNIGRYLFHELVQTFVRGACHTGIYILSISDTPVIVYFKVYLVIFYDIFNALFQSDKCSLNVSGRLFVSWISSRHLCYVGWLIAQLI